MHLFELTLLQHRQDLGPDGAILCAGLVEKDETLNCDRHAQGHDEQAGINKEAAILKELDGQIEGVHEVVSGEKRWLS
jgi:hypothetical protein